MANTKYSLCTNGNQAEAAVASASAIPENEDFIIEYNGFQYKSLEEFDANNMPKEIIMGKPNVVKAFAGTKVVNGVDTGEPCVVVGVKKKVDSKELSDDDLVPSVLPDGVITDVIECQEIIAFGTCTDGDSGACYPHGESYRPLQGGISAIEENSTACTLGLVVKDSTTNNLVALTNNHCSGLLYDPAYSAPTYGSTSVVGNHMVQPSPYDGGGVSDRYGTVVRAVAMEFGTGSGQDNLVDCAISSINIDEASTPILDLNNGPFPFASKSEYSVGTQVYKVGRTTGSTPPPITTITDALCAVNVYYGPVGGSDDKDVASFSNQIEYQASSRFSQGGDSGSAVVALIDGQYKVIGLHFAGNAYGTIGYASHISDIATTLSVEAWNGDIVVAECVSPSIKVNDVCYERVGDTSDPITHTVDDEFANCVSCEGAIDVSSSSSSESTVSASSITGSSGSSASSSSLESRSSSSTKAQSSSSSSKSSSSPSSSSKSSSSQSSSTQLMSSSSSSDVTASSSSSEFEGDFIEQAPTELSLQVGSDNSISLSWKRLYKATGYIIERKVGFADWQSLATVAVTSYADSNLVPGKYYRYRVRGYVDV